MIYIFIVLLYKLCLMIVLFIMEVMWWGLFGFVFRRVRCVGAPLMLLWFCYCAVYVTAVWCCCTIIKVRYTEIVSYTPETITSRTEKPLKAMCSIYIYLGYTLAIIIDVLLKFANSPSHSLLPSIRLNYVGRTTRLKGFSSAMCTGRISYYKTD